MVDILVTKTPYSYTQYLQHHTVLGVYGINCEMIDILVTKTHVTFTNNIYSTTHSRAYTV
jgi:hypothetical protein